MTLLTDEVRGYIGVEGPRVAACDIIEAGAVRRYAQAIMDRDEAYHKGRPDVANGRPIAPPLYPVFMFRTPFDATDYLTERASDPDFDGAVTGVSNGLPELPLHGLALLNGGAEVECFRHPEHGDTIYQQARYADITERMSKSGPMLLVVVDTVYSIESGESIMRYRKTLIRR